MSDSYYILSLLLKKKNIYLLVFVVLSTSIFHSFSSGFSDCFSYLISGFLSIFSLEICQIQFSTGHDSCETVKGVAGVTVLFVFVCQVDCGEVYQLQWLSFSLPLSLFLSHCLSLVLSPSLSLSLI